MPGTADPLAELPSAACSCEHDRALTHDAELVLAPDTRRWRSWTVGLEALLTELAEGPAHALILSQPSSARWLEVRVGHGELRVEVPSNLILQGDARLRDDDERRLRALGFRRPELGRTTWRLDEPIALVARSTELVAHVLVTFVGLDAARPLVVDRFGADRPCRACSAAA